MLKKILIISSLFVMSCANLNTRERGSGPKDTEVNKQEGIRSTKAKDIAIVFGPGGMKTFAQIGVLKNMESERFQVKMVTGVEWGAAIANVYAKKGKTHDLEWQMSKIRSEHLPKPGFFKNNIDLENPNRLNLFFEKVFQAHNLANNSISSFCPTTSNQRSRASWLNSGPAYKVLKKCVAYPPLFYSYNGWRAEPFAIQEAIEKIRSSGDYTIILIDVLANEDFSKSRKTIDQEAEKILWQEVKRETKNAAKMADYYISIDTTNFSFLDHAKYRDIISEGKKQSLERVKRIAEEIYGTL